MGGNAVKQIEEFLFNLKLYAGPIDSAFGGGVASAVKCYQKLKGLAPSGVVDPATWTSMFPNDPLPVSEVASCCLADRCLALTGAFETGKYPPDCFWGIAGDFDGMGISFGALQWNVGQGTLQPLLSQMFTQYPDVSRNVLHEHFDTLSSMAGAAINDQLTFARSIQTRGTLQEPWQGMLVTLGRTAEYQKVQSDHATRIFQQALQMCAEYGLVSERAVALMFDVATQGGSIGSLVKAQIMADFAQLPKNAPGNEVAKMCSVANRRAAASSPQFVDDVRTRKLAIANGTGTVHGIYYDLDDMFGLTMNPFSAGLAAAAK
jgi:hypothetical protein